MIVSQLSVYPLKSCQGINLPEAEVRTKGFLWDREMMLVSGSGKFITQRQFPQLALVRVEINDRTISISLEDRSLPSLSFSVVPTGKKVEVEIWRDRIMAVDRGDEIAAWFHRFLNLDGDKICRLVQQSPEHIRPIAKKYPDIEDIPLGFADNYPLMLTNTASLAELNQRIVEIHLSQKQAVSMDCFRPNIVIDSTEPFIEDRWSTIEIGEIRFQVVKPCSRCIITTVNKQTGMKNQSKEPLSTLGTFRQLSEQGVMFGVNMIPQNQGTIKVGDRLEVLETRF